MTLDDFVRTAQSAWPAWSGADAPRFLAWIEAQHAIEGQPLQLDSLRAADLWLAAHAAWGVPEAQRAFEEHCLRDVPRHLQARRASAAQAEEAVQRLRHHLLLPSGGRPPRLLDYAGRGELRGWVKVAAVRNWLNLERETRREHVGVSDDRLVDQAAGDLELDFLKGSFRESFHRAFLAAVAALPGEERLVLKMYYLDRATMEDIGRVVGAHRITVLRRLERTRAWLADETKRRIAHEHALSGTEVESLVRLIQSRLDVSLRHAFEARDSSTG